METAKAWRNREANFVTEPLHLLSPLHVTTLIVYDYKYEVSPKGHLKLDNGNVHRWIYRLGSGGVEKRPSFVQMFHHAPPLMLKPHWHAQSEVNFIVRGSVRYSMHTHELNLHAGALVFFWGGLPHQLIDASEDAVYAGGHLPPIHFFRLKLPEEALHQLMHGATLLTTATDPTDQINFLRWTEYVQSGDPARANHTVTELLLRLERMRFDHYEIVGGRQPQEVQPVSERLQAFRNLGLMCGFIADNFLDEIDTASIASSVGLHPKYAMRLFKKSTGMAIMEYVSLLRLSYAQALLLHEDANILDVAMESGFRSISGFNKSFRKMAGMSPSDFRREELARD